MVAADWVDGAVDLGTGDPIRQADVGLGEKLLDPASGCSGGVDPTCEHTGGADPANSAWMGSTDRALIHSLCINRGLLFEAVGVADLQKSKTSASIIFFCSSVPFGARGSLA